MNKAASRFEVRGVHVLAGMLAFFGAVIAVNVAFVVAALDTFPGEDVRRSYLQGLTYNATLAERRAQAAQGWSASAGLRQVDDGALLEVIVRDAAGAPINGLDTEGALRWPSAARFDRAIQFEPVGDGRYVARLGPLREGRWELRARAGARNRGALDFEADLTWPS